MMRKDISRQRRWQLKQRKLGRCELCGKKNARGYRMCAVHVIANRLRQRAKHKCNPKKPYGRGRPIGGSNVKHKIAAQ